MKQLNKKLTPLLLLMAGVLTLLVISPKVTHAFDNLTNENKQDTLTLKDGKKQEVVVGTSGQTKPMDYFDDNNQLTGFEVDVLKEIEKRSGKIHLSFKTAEFASLFAGLDSKKFDLLINNLGESKDRRAKYLYSKYPYVITHNVLITKEDQKDNLTFKDMKGKSFGVVTASPQSQFLEAWNKNNPSEQVKIQYVDSDPSQIIRDVHSGRFDATIYATTYLYDVEKTFGIHLKAHPITDEEAIRPPGSYFIYRKDDLPLRNEIDQALESMRQDGTLTKISMKYLGQDDTKVPAEIKKANDALEEKLIASTKNKEQTSHTSKKTDGKIFAPEIIPNNIAHIAPKLPVTLIMTFVSAIVGIILGFLIALVKIKKIPVLNQILTVFVSFMRGTPQLVQLFLSFYGLPLILEVLNKKIGTQIDLNHIPALIYVFIALGLNEAAYTSETFRAAILSVDKDEIEAGKAIGLTSWQTMRRIILPSALIVAVPNLGNSLISLLKSTSLAFTVTVIDIMGEARIIAGANLRFFEAYIAVALLYWGLCILIEQGIKAYEKHLNKSGLPIGGGK